MFDNGVKLFARRQLPAQRATLTIAGATADQVARGGASPLVTSAERKIWRWGDENH
ncbi:MAG TPA: hypothetical protein PKD37_04875 [Oligoflexia bacterium]|nr:hypothetical protein [Oligoflexia bacterium]